MGAFFAVVLFSRKPFGAMWMIFKMLRPHLRETRA